MITPLLEKLILLGHAEYKTWTIGTGNPELQVRDNECVIITDIDYFPFIDSRINLNTGATNWPKANKQLTFSDNKKRFNFLVRTYFIDNEGVIQNVVHFDSYMVFNNTVCVSILTIPSTTTWTVTGGAAPAGTPAQRPPLGYGATGSGGLQGTNRYKYATATEVKPHRRSTLNPAAPVTFDDFQCEANAGTVLVAVTPAVGELTNYQYPLITVGYVSIKENLIGQVL